MMESEAHDAFAPLFNPAQVHTYGPEPVTADAVPALQRPVEGVVVWAVLCDGPHSPLTVKFAWHESFVPPSRPLQFHVNGPVPDTVVASPVAQRPEVGAE
jgi:hypothetical protein